MAGYGWPWRLCRLGSFCVLSQLFLSAVRQISWWALAGAFHFLGLLGLVLVVLIDDLFSE